MPAAMGWDLPLCAACSPRTIPPIQPGIGVGIADLQVIDNKSNGGEVGIPYGSQLRVTMKPNSSAMMQPQTFLPHCRLLPTISDSLGRDGNSRTSQDSLGLSKN